MKKSFLIAFGILFGIGYLSLRADQIPDTETPNGESVKLLTSSAQVFLNGGTLYGIDMSTGNGVDYFVAFDTVSVPAGATYSSFVSSVQAITPQEVFYSSTSVNGTAGGLITGMQSLSWRPYGIRIRYGLYIYMSTLINQVAVHFKK